MVPVAPVKPVAPVAPVDLVTANRPRVSPGDKPLPLQVIFRGRLDADLGARMAAGQAAMEEAVGLTASHLEALSLTAEPKGLPAVLLNPAQRAVLRALLAATSVDRTPDGGVALRSYRDAILGQPLDE